MLLTQEQKRELGRDISKGKFKDRYCIDFHGCSYKREPYKADGLIPLLMQKLSLLRENTWFSESQFLRPTAASCGMAGLPES